MILIVKKRSWLESFVICVFPALFSTKRVNHEGSEYFHDFKPLKKLDFSITLNFLGGPFERQMKLSNYILRGGSTYNYLVSDFSLSLRLKRIKESEYYASG